MTSIRNFVGGGRDRSHHIFNSYKKFENGNCSCIQPLPTELNHRWMLAINNATILAIGRTDGSVNVIFKLSYVQEVENLDTPMRVLEFHRHLKSQNNY